MDIAFLLQTHNANPHIGRLVNVLRQFPNSQIYCHHDFSQSQLHDSLVSAQNVQYVSPHRITAWARVSAVLAVFDLLKLSFESMQHAEWFVLLSGNCYPIKPISHIFNFLKSTKFNGFIDFCPAIKGAEGLPGWRWNSIYSRPFCKVPFISRKGKFYWREVRIPRQGVPFSDTRPLMYGSNWFILNRQLVEKVLIQDPYNHPIVNFFDRIEKEEDHHYSLEECFFQSFFYGSSADGICRDALRFIDWKDAKDWHPNTLTEAHWDDIVASNGLFARKFDFEKSRYLLDRIDSQILCH